MTPPRFLILMALRRVAIATVIAYSLQGCAAFSKTATEEEATAAREQIQGIGNTASAMLPPPFSYGAAAGTAIVLLVAGLMRGKGKPVAPPPNP